MRSSSGVDRRGQASPDSKRRKLFGDEPEPNYLRTNFLEAGHQGSPQCQLLDILAN